MTQKDHIINILRDVQKSGGIEGHSYLVAKAEQIMSYTDEIPAKKEEIAEEEKSDMPWMKSKK